MTHELPGQCPVCGEALEVARLHCPNCSTTIEGRFALDRFARLSREHMQVPGGLSARARGDQGR